MQHPDERDRERDVEPVDVGRPFQGRRLRACTSGGAGNLEGAPHQTEQHDGTQQMNREVDEVIAANVDAADGVVDRKRKVDDRTARGRQFTLRKEDRRRSEVANRCVLHHRRVVVEDEGSGKAVPVSEDAGEYDDRHAPPQRRWGRSRCGGRRRGGGSTFSGHGFRQFIPCYLSCRTLTRRTHRAQRPPRAEGTRN